MSKNNYLTKVVAYDMNQSSEASHLYLDLCAVNNDTGNAGIGPSPLRFTESRSRAILTDPSSYYVSIVRFKIDTSLLPVMLPVIQLNQINPNLTIYSFTLSYKGFDFQSYIIFEPQDLNTSQPLPPTTHQDVNSGYYYLYNFAFFVNLCNKALTAAFNGLAELIDLPTSHSPFLLYDPSSNQLVFNADVTAYDNSLEDPIQIYFNIPCYNLFSSFQCSTISYASPIGKNYLLLTTNDQGFNVAELNTYSALQIYQDYISSQLWSCVQSICLTSSTLPINGTMQGISSLNGTSNNINYNTNISVPIISDFEVALTTGLDYKPSISYSPTMYRLIDMYGHTDITNITIDAYWKDNQNNLHPLLMPANANSNLKILFRKKYLQV